LSEVKSRRTFFDLVLSLALRLFIRLVSTSKLVVASLELLSSN
jgi:hypothetical protein